MTLTKDRISSNQDPAGRTSSARHVATGTIGGVLVLHAVTLVAAFTRTEPYPPLALVPFIAATVALGVTALPMARAGLRAGWALALTFAGLSMISFGPHKLLLGDMPDIAPAVVVGFGLEAALALVAVGQLRATSR